MSEQNELWLLKTSNDYNKLFNGIGVYSCAYESYLNKNSGKIVINKAWEAFEETLDYKSLGMYKESKRQMAFDNSLYHVPLEQDIRKKNVIYHKYFSTKEMKKVFQLEIYRFIYSQLLLSLSLIKTGSKSQQIIRVKELKRFYNTSRYNEDKAYSWSKVQTFVNKNRTNWGNNSLYLLSQEVCFSEAYLIIEELRKNKESYHILIEKLRMLQQIKYPYIRLGLFKNIVNKKEDMCNVSFILQKKSIDEFEDFIDTSARSFLQMIYRLDNHNYFNGIEDLEKLVKVLEETESHNENVLENVCKLIGKALTEEYEKLFHESLDSWKNFEENFLKVSAIADANLTGMETTCFNYILWNWRSKNS